MMFLSLDALSSLYVLGWGVGWKVGGLRKVNALILKSEGIPMRMLMIWYSNWFAGISYLIQVQVGE